jgi:hypothetical protein
MLSVVVSVTHIPCSVRPLVVESLLDKASVPIRHRVEITTPGELLQLAPCEVSSRLRGSRKHEVVTWLEAAHAADVRAVVERIDTRFRDRLFDHRVTIAIALENRHDIVPHE